MANSAQGAGGLHQGGAVWLLDAGNVLTSYRSEAREGAGNVLTSYRSEAREAMTLDCRSLAPSSAISSKLQESVGTSLSKVYISMAGLCRSSGIPRAEMPQDLRKAQDLGTIRNPEWTSSLFFSEPSRHSSFRLGLSSPTHISAGTATRSTWVYTFQGQVSLCPSWNCDSFAATSTLAGRMGDQVQNRSQSSVACRRGVAVGRREPVTRGLRKAESAPSQP